ncbi:MAG TPA: hypothetical protein VIL52_00605 [Bacteroidota bacterium]
MVGLHHLWMPVLLSAVFVFIASSIIHMFSGWHKNDYAKVPDEDKVMDALRPFNIPPGDYMMPRAEGMADMKSEAFLDKLDKGPVIMFSAWKSGRGSASMTGSLVWWFIYSVAISVFAGYVAGRALPAGAEYLEVFRFAGATAFLGYAAALWPMTIWYKRSWKTAFKETIDGLIYGLITAGTFGWLWPAKYMGGM